NAGLGGKNEIEIDGRPVSRRELVHESEKSARSVLDECGQLLTTHEEYTQQRNWHRLWIRRNLTQRKKRLRGFLRRTVIPSAELVAWAKDDPAFEQLRNNRTYGPRFRQLVARFETKKPHEKPERQEIATRRRRLPRRRSDE